YRDFHAATNTSIYEGFNQAELKKLSHKNYTLYGLDLCDYKSLRKVFEENQITHIVNLAALAGVRPSTQKPVLYQKNNGESTSNLCDLAREFGIKKFVQASSSSVYGARSKVPFSENEDISKPISPYAASKVADEARLHTFHHLYKIPTVALRFFTVYGARQRPDLAIHKFAKLIDQSKEIEIYGDGSFRRDFTYIEDILDGVIKAIDLDCNFEIFNLGESQTTDVNTLVDLLEAKLGKKAIRKYIDAIPGDVPVTFADISKSKSILQYNPQTKIDKGLDKFVEWFREVNQQKLSA
ncbi:MAG: GDP-mannose 4,6-dehydratase, partial [Candidatus Caenarcaniphilales bacterium]|nr:GDP-mannose 4,6-dehydratase [Candidatus Caenarcaniphilales bacterium]